MKKFSIAFLLVLFLIAMIVVISCEYQGEEKPNKNPFIILANSPPDSATVAQAPIFWWYAPDEDGYVTQYQWADFSKSTFDTVLYEQYEDDPTLIPDEYWVSVESTFADTIYLSHDTVDFNAGEPTEHLFCIKAIDDDGAESEITCIIIFRTNIPPFNMEILAFPSEKDSFLEYPEFTREEVLDSMKYDTLWCLLNTTYSWQGLNFVWDAEDPDDPVIMEYFWWIVEEDSRDMIQTSADSRYHENDDGVDTLDGWISSSAVIITGLPTGSYIFYIKARDDAFYESDPDSAFLTVVAPYTDLSDSTVIEEWVTQGIPLSILVVDATNDGIAVGTWEPVNGDVHDFYESMFTFFKSNGDIFDYTHIEAPNAVNSFPGQDGDWSTWRLGMASLAEHNIVYWYDANATARNSGITPIIARQLGSYVEIGGRLIIDGRKCLGPAVDENDYFSFAYQYLGLCAGGLCFSGGYAWADHGHEYFRSAQSVYPDEYPSLYPDPDPEKDLGLIEGILPGIGRLYPRPAYGMPYSRVIYTFDCDTSAGVYDEYQYDGVAMEYVTPSFRTLYFEFPLYFMDNSVDNDGNGVMDVEQTMRQAFKFIQEPPVLEEEEEDQTRFW